MPGSSEELGLIQAILWTDEASSGRLALEEGDLPRADELLTAACERARDHFGEADPRHAEGLFHLARLRFVQGQPERAERLDRESLRLRAASLGEDHPDTLASLLCVALFYGGLHEAQLQRALEAGQERFGADSWQVARLYARLWTATQDAAWYRQALACAAGCRTAGPPAAGGLNGQRGRDARPKPPSSRPAMSRP